MENAAWGRSGPFAMPSSRDTRESEGMDMQIWTGDQEVGHAYIFQEIYPPAVIESAAFEMDCRVGFRAEMERP